ncbi:hypothetical protein F7725_028511 [Dissostichus mawsoni]|uniref:Sema domain-containing protein n=1 Tax=Dissostichus mawsoni TaxID=36200 RepID=A0A7J5XGJ1_DISMA|nr:hypothetical protein F7725_028511 [Dissostichus mawsoni]
MCLFLSSGLRRSEPSPAPMGRPGVTQHALLLLQCMLVLRPGGVASRRGPVLLPESPCHKTEHPLVPHSEMEPWMCRFKAEGTVDYSQLTFDPGQNELIVGARNHLFRLNLEDLSLIQEAEWHCDEFTKGACFSRGKSEEECQNYIRVLLVNGNRLFTCGTNAFTPICTNRTISGMARCPYNPLHNSTALITSSGELYAATAMDFSGRDPAIYRSLGEPNFVSSYDIGNFTYFFFRENAVEHDCGRTVFSRAGRVCKNDIGGRFLLEDTWTTFMKARLNCSRPGEIPFNYNELQGTFYLPELELLNSIAASAVCAFNLSAISQKFLLMHEVVQPVVPVPYFMEDNVRFTHVAVDVVQGKDTLLHIIYLATGGFIEIELFPPRKRQPIRSLLILHSRSELACIGARDPYCGWDLLLKKCTTLEESVRMSQWEQSISKCPVRNVTVDGGFGVWSGWSMCSHNDGGSTGSCLCRTRGCDNPAPHTTCGIGFQVRQRSCSNPTPRHGGRVCVGQNREERYCNEHLPCPTHVYWSAWSAWDRCTQPCGGGIQSRRRTCENGDECPGCGQKTTPWTPWTPVNISDNGGHYEQRFRYTCKARIPDPSLMEVGRQRIEMRYCSREVLRLGRISGHTLNGGWASWSSWSQCSRDCSRGIRSRKRTCSNPEPKHGVLGDVWGGHHMRTRTCSNPPPEYGGDICLGLHTEEALCHTQSCPESWSKWSEWSHCESNGAQTRVRHCDVLFPTGNQCSGNNKISIARSSQEERRCGDFNLFHMIAVGLSSSVLGCLVTLLVYSYCQRYTQQAHDATPDVSVLLPLDDPAMHQPLSANMGAFNKNNLILEERNKYFNPQLAGKTYTNAYFTDLNTYDDY